MYCFCPFCPVPFTTPNRYKLMGMCHGYFVFFIYCKISCMCYVNMHWLGFLELLRTNNMVFAWWSILYFYGHAYLVFGKILSRNVPECPLVNAPIMVPFCSFLFSSFHPTIIACPKIQTKAKFNITVLSLP